MDNVEFELVIKATSEPLGRLLATMLVEGTLCYVVKTTIYGFKYFKIDPIYEVRRVKND